VARSDLAEVRHHANASRRKKHQITCTQSIAPYSSESYYISVSFLHAPSVSKIIRCKERGAGMQQGNKEKTATVSYPKKK
jgi:hypothetical protein